jgi:hypothetical protein
MPTVSYGMSELLAALVQAYGAPRPTSFGLGELLEDLVQAIEDFGGGAGLGPGFAAVKGLNDDSGFSNQTAAFQTAAATLPSEGGTLFVPAGVYGAVWTVPTNVSLFCAGQGGQAGPGATQIVIPSGTADATTAPWALNMANTGCHFYNGDVSGGGRGAYNSVALVGSAGDQLIMNAYISRGRYAAFQGATGGAPPGGGQNRGRMTNVVTDAGTIPILQRTITGTVGFTTGSKILTDTGGSFSSQDVGLGISANPANTAGIMLGTRLAANATVSIGSSVVALSTLAGTGLALNSVANILAAPGTVSVMTDQGYPATFTYSGISGTTLTGMVLTSGTASWTVSTGDFVVNPTQIVIDQTPTQSTTGNTGTIGIIAGFSSIVGGTDTQLTVCRFVQGTNVFAGTSSAIQATQCHFTNTRTSVDSPGGLLFEGSANLWGCYQDSCPVNGSALVHKQNAKEVLHSDGYGYNNITTNPNFYTENDNQNGITLRNLVMQPPNGPWNSLVNLAGGPNSGVIVDGINVVGQMPFLIRTSFTGGVPFSGSIGIWGLTNNIKNNDNILVNDGHGNTANFTANGAAAAGALTMNVTSVGSLPAGWFASSAGYVSYDTTSWSIGFVNGPYLQDLFTGAGAQFPSPYGCGQVSNIMANGVQIDFDYLPLSPVTVPVVSNAATVIPGLTRGANNVSTTGNSGFTVTLPLLGNTDPLFDGQPLSVRIFDGHNAGQAITWNNTEGAPPGSTSGAASTVPLTIPFQYNIGTGLWRYTGSGGGGGGGTGSYTVIRTGTGVTMNPNTVYVVTAVGTYALPGSPTPGQWVTVKSDTTATITITGTIDGVTSPTITTQYQSNTYVYDGTVWSNI